MFESSGFLKIFVRYTENYFIIPGGRDTNGKLFGKGIIEFENGDLITGMFKVLSIISSHMEYHYYTTKTDVDILLLTLLFKIGWEKKR